jgi:hypothetical protein
VVAREVETVLAAMRARPNWYADHVERPFGRKQAPVMTARGQAEMPPLVFTERADVDDTHLAALASVAIGKIQKALAGGCDPRVVVPEVIRTAFASDGGGHDIDQPPFASADYEARVSAVLRDPAQLERVVAAVLQIVG